MHTKESHESDTHSGTNLRNRNSLVLKNTLPPSPPKEAWVEHTAEKVSGMPEIGERDQFGSSNLLKGSIIRSLRAMEVSETEV